MHELPIERYAELLLGMRSAYQSDQNMIEWAKREFLTPGEASKASVQEAVIRLAYDMQAGSYVQLAMSEPERYERWCQQMAESIEPWIPQGPFSLLEVGVGEGTTLSGVLIKLGRQPVHSSGVDISFARLVVAAEFLRRNAQSSLLALASLFRMPFADNSIDVVYSSHSLEPNGGREREAIAELLRVSRRYVVLVEPNFEGASAEARARMAQHGYVRDLEKAARSAGAQIVFQQNMEYSVNPMNPSGLLVLKKARLDGQRELDHVVDEIPLSCPVTRKPLRSSGDALLGSEEGFSYPVAAGIPLLTVENMVFRNPAFSPTQLVRAN